MSAFLVLLVCLSTVLTVALLRMKVYRPPTKLERDLAELGRRIDTFRLVIVDEFTPAMRRAAASFSAFAEAYKKGSGHA